MIAPRVEVLNQFPGAFVLERVAVNAGASGFWDRGRLMPVRLERWKDGDGKPYRWRLLVGPRAVLDVKVPILFNGEDPHERFAGLVQNDLPGCVSTLDLEGPLHGWWG